MEPVISQTREEGEESSLELIPSGSKIPDRMLCDQFETSVSTVNFQDLFSPIGLGKTLQSSDFNLDDNTLGADTARSPTAIDFELSINIFSTPSPNAQFPFSLPLPLPPTGIPTFPQGHNYSAWPKQGLIDVHKCERKCQFCGLAVRTTATLRKHVNDHKKKDGFNIEIAASSSGRQQRALLLDIGASTPGQLTPYPRQLQSSPFANEPHTLTSDFVQDCPTDLSEALTVITRLQQQNNRLQQENTALKAELQALKINYEQPRTLMHMSTNLASTVSWETAPGVPPLEGGIFMGHTFGFTSNWKKAYSSRAPGHNRHFLLKLWGLN
ncbi:hypothetical protein GGS24DRAFT_499906 [Hypoxylon argillaceum]|nr:hypothetical protein GGS24DRAFT_499906 [Hypoxylon argillaceum]